MPLDTPSALRDAPLRVRLDAGRSYPVLFDALERLPAHLRAAGLPAGRTLLITDEHVAAHYRAPVEAALREAGWRLKTLVLPPGEATKSTDHLQTLYDAALAWGLDRQTPVLALGGGVVGDLAGFAAATLLRGLPLVQLPTSLIAQVDSALGGKTGINHAAGKNLIGAFYQPRLVLADVRALQTLPKREWTSGLAEALKHALIADPALLSFLEDRRAAVLACDADTVAALIPHAARIKADIVSEDERETGRRAVLNFGHTFGHAIERVAGYGVFTHGEAVALGMRAALHLSHHLHPESIPLERLARLVGMIPVEQRLAALPTADLMRAMQTDKKVLRGTVRFVVLRRPGAAYLTGEVSEAAVEAAWAFAKEGHTLL